MPTCKSCQRYPKGEDNWWCSCCSDYSEYTPSFYQGWCKKYNKQCYTALCSMHPPIEKYKDCPSYVDIEELEELDY